MPFALLISVPGGNNWRYEIIIVIPDSKYTKNGTMRQAYDYNRPDRHRLENTEIHQMVKKLYLGSALGDGQQMVL